MSQRPDCLRCGHNQISHCDWIDATGWQGPPGDCIEGECSYRHYVPPTCGCEQFICPPDWEEPNPAMLLVLPRGLIQLPPQKER